MNRETMSVVPPGAKVRMKSHRFTGKLLAGAFAGGWPFRAA